MEDRQTPGLYLELVDADPSALGPRRSAHLATLAGVDRVSWWTNLAPGRDELPMKVPDGRLLVVAEVDDSFGPPTDADGTAVHFRRYPRPGQGCLTGRPTIGLLVVWISPKEESLAQPLRDWADFVHIRHIAAAGVPGYTQITPYENVASGDPRFMHFYEMDTDDPEAAYQLMPKLVAERLGASTPEFAAWADWRAAGSYIVYCNTFSRLGATS
ncbi:MAG: hypothetical protein ACYDH6_15060 [Acidimicrobiales bacterium]